MSRSSGRKLVVKPCSCSSGHGSSFFPSLILPKCLYTPTTCMRCAVDLETNMCLCASSSNWARCASRARSPLQCQWCQMTMDTNCWVNVKLSLRELQCILDLEPRRVTSKPTPLGLYLGYDTDAHHGLHWKRWGWRSIQTHWHRDKKVLLRRVPRLASRKRNLFLPRLDSRTGKDRNPRTRRSMVLATGLATEESQ